MGSVVVEKDDRGSIEAEACSVPASQRKVACPSRWSFVEACWSAESVGPAQKGEGGAEEVVVDRLRRSS